MDTVDNIYPVKKLFILKYGSILNLKFNLVLNFKCFYIAILFNDQ